MKIAFFDFEASDKDPKTARITEIGLVLIDVDSKKEIVSMGTLLWDESYEPIHPDASAITGITDELIKAHGQGPRFAMAQFGHFLTQADYICGHNIKRYDIPLLEHELKRNLLELEKLPPLIDTRTDIEFPSYIATRKLAYLAAEYGINSDGAHCAVHDCRTTAKLLFKHDLEKVIENSKIPEIYIRADVSFHEKDKAKEKMYFWDAPKKIWVKQIKENMFYKECDESSFTVLRLNDYQPPEQN